jgi:NADP-dependent aldehyde dehydrogenase
LIIGIESEELQNFITTLGEEIKNVAPAPMLHPGISKLFSENRSKALSQQDVQTVAVSETAPGENYGVPTLASASGQAFLNNPVLHQEVFGPYSIVIRCRDKNEMTAVAKNLEGQLTATFMATDDEIIANDEFTEAVKNICGRFILNSVPTGVEVCLAMQHGGPFPATTDSRYTSVGADGIKRFARPVCFQNWSDRLLPEELKKENPTGIWTTQNKQLTKSAL